MDNNIAVLVRVARQVEGEYIMVDVMKADANAERLKAYLSTANLPQTMEQDGVGYVITYGVHENVSLNDEN